MRKFSLRKWFGCFLRGHSWSEKYVIYDDNTLKMKSLRRHCFVCGRKEKSRV